MTLIACLTRATAAALIALGSSESACQAEPHTTAECAWDAVPIEKQHELLAAYAQHGSDGFGSVSIDNSLIDEAGGRCGVVNRDAEHMQSVSVAIAGAAMRHGAEEQLHSVAGDPAKLDNVWKNDDADREALLVETQQSMQSRGDPRQLFRAVRGLMQQAGVTIPATNPMSDPSFRAYADYFMGRALEDRASANFQR